MTDPNVIRVSISIKAVFCVADSRRQQRRENSDYAIKYEHPWDAPDPHGIQLGILTRQPGSSREPKVLQPSGKIGGTIAFLQTYTQKFIHPKQLSSFPERLELPFPDRDPSYVTVLLRG